MPAYLIDCGHGGHENVQRSTAFGAIGPRGLREKDLTLAIGRRVAEILGPEAILTRNRDHNLSIGQRLEVAARSGAGALISIHANQGPPGARGAESWVHERAGSASRALAGNILEELRRLGGAAREVMSGNLAVLTPERLPPGTAACLVEVDYLSNPEREAWLLDPRHQEAIAQAIARGVGRYGRNTAAAQQDQTAPAAGTCSGWESDCQSFSIVAARYFRSDCLGNTATASPLTVDCAASGRSGVVHFDDGVHVDVTWEPSTRTVRCTELVYPGGDRSAPILGPWAEYTYDCEASGRVNLTPKTGGERWCSARRGTSTGQGVPAVGAPLRASSRGLDDPQNVSASNDPPATYRYRRSESNVQNAGTFRSDISFQENDLCFQFAQPGVVEDDNGTPEEPFDATVTVRVAETPFSDSNPPVVLAEHSVRITNRKVGYVHFTGFPQRDPNGFHIHYEVLVVNHIRHSRGIVLRMWSWT